MYQYKTAGIVQALMSALSLAAVRNRTLASSPRRRSLRPDAAARDAIPKAQHPKETYFQMEQQSRWNR